MRGRKNIALCFLVLDFLFASAQDTAKTVLRKDPQKPDAVLKTNPLAMIWGHVPFTSEFRFVDELTTARWQSLQFGVSVFGKSPVLYLLEEQYNHKHKGQRSISYEVHGFRFQFAYKFYLSRKRFAPCGWYLAPDVSFSTVKLSTVHGYQFGSYIQATQYNLNVMIGKQSFRKKFAIDYFFGVGWKQNSWQFVYSPTRIKRLDIKNIPYYFEPLNIFIGINFGKAY